MHIIRSHIVPEGTDRIRFSDYAFLIFGEFSSRKGIKKAIKRGAIRIEDKLTPTGVWIEAGQQINWYDLEERPPKAYQMALEVVFEDEYIAVIKKPAGVVVSGNQFRTIENALSANLSLSTKADALKWPKPVHRLDAPTSGLLIIAKTVQARIKLGQALEQKKIEKQYQAIVIGAAPEKGCIEAKLEDKDAITHYDCLKKIPSLRCEYLSLMNLYPKTGRTHQLRKHLASIDLPILGDKLYGKEGLILKGKGLFLTAVGLKFMHPILEEELTFQIPAPEKFDTYLAREQRRWESYQKK